MPLVLVKILKWDTLCKIVVDGFAYDWAPHNVQLKWTYCHIIESVIKVRFVIVTNACIKIKRFPIPFVCINEWIITLNPKPLKINL